MKLLPLPQATNYLKKLSFKISCFTPFKGMESFHCTSTIKYVIRKERVKGIAEYILENLKTVKILQLNIVLVTQCTYIQ